jgi:NADH-quinone oxidoreductase subunit L
MGGLKKELPITYWTFLIGAIAIAGVAPLSGFFSKDEILFETFVTGHTLLWTIGTLTALLTATYMFRLVFLTFHGERQHSGLGTRDSGSDDHHRVPDPGSPIPAHGHGAGSHLHDAPPAMALALIVLAIGSVAAGWVGVPHAIGGHNELGAWLQPAFSAPAAAGEGAAAEPSAGAEGAAGAEDHTALERRLMSLSLTIALVGIAFARFVWIKRRRVADNMAREFPGLHRLLLNKYYVDELYDATVVQPIKAASTEGLWRWFDVKVIDGAVNGAASIVEGGAAMLRRLQSGSVRAYAGSLFVGVVVILGYYLWR